MTVAVDGTLTVGELTAMAEARPQLRFELTPEGMIYATVALRGRHNALIMRLALWLARHLPEVDGRIQQDTGVQTRIAGATGYRQPDLMLFTQEPPDDLYLDPALVLLVVEVSSPSTRRVDFEEKQREYAASGIPHYWIVDSAENVRLYRRDPNADIYHEYDARTVPLTELLARKPQEFLG